jgi:hypothetical protein
VDIDQYPIGFPFYPGEEKGEEAIYPSFIAGRKNMAIQRLRKR